MGTTSGRSPPTGKLKRETRNVPGLGSENLGPPAKERDQRGGQRARLGQKGRQGGGKRSTRLLGTGVRGGGVTRETEALTRAAPRPVKTHDPIDALF